MAVRLQGPSTVPNPLGADVPVPMSKGMIDEIIEAYAAACARCEKAGLHGAEIHGAHGYLIQQFLSPNTNKREDEYGGSFENRMRFLIEVMQASQDATSKDFAVGVRLAPDLTVGGVGSRTTSKSWRHSKRRVWSISSMLASGTTIPSPR